MWQTTWQNTPCVFILGSCRDSDVMFLQTVTMQRQTLIVKSHEKKTEQQSHFKSFNSKNASLKKDSTHNVSAHRNQTATTITRAPSWSGQGPGTRHHRWVLHRHLQAEEPQTGHCWNIWISGLLFTPRLNPARRSSGRSCPSVRLDHLSPRRPWSVSRISRPSRPESETRNSETFQMGLFMHGKNTF